MDKYLELAREKWGNREDKLSIFKIAMAEVFAAVRDTGKIYSLRWENIHFATRPFVMLSPTEIVYISDVAANALEKWCEVLFSLYEMSSLPMPSEVFQRSDGFFTVLNAFLNTEVFSLIDVAIRDLERQLKKAEKERRKSRLSKVVQRHNDNTYGIDKAAIEAYLKQKHETESRKQPDPIVEEIPVVNPKHKEKLIASRRERRKEKIRRYLNQPLPLLLDFPAAPIGRNERRVESDLAYFEDRRWAQSYASREY